MIIIDRQTDKLIQATISDKDGPIDLTDTSLTWRFWKDGEVVIEKTETDGIEITNASEGKIEMELTNVDTDLARGRYEYELLIEDVENNRYLPKKGTLMIETNKSAKED